MSFIERRKFIKGLLGSLAVGSLLPWIDNFNGSVAAQTMRTTAATATEAGGASLWEKAAGKGIIYGAASTYKFLHADLNFAKVFLQECKIFVPEGDVKWSVLRPSPTEFDFKAFDWLINFTQSNNILFRGHTLVWHDALPQWFSTTVNADNAEKFLLDHISTVVKRHAGKIHSWDVVNESIAIWDKNPDGLRSSSPWYKLLGAGYIDIAFRAAAQADPKAMLVLNQNHIEQDGDDETRSAVLKLLKRMQAAGTPIHALGIEAHLGNKNYLFNKSKFKTFLRDVANMGLKIIITEMDVTDIYITANVAARDQIIAGIYEEFLTVALAEPAVIGVLTWGLSDKYSWIQKYYPRKDGVPARPLPLDCNFRRKPAWYALARAFDQAPKRA